MKETPAAARTAVLAGDARRTEFVRGHPLLVTMACCVGTFQLCGQAATVVQILFATRLLGLPSAESA